MTRDQLTVEAVLERCGCRRVKEKVGREQLFPPVSWFAVSEFSCSTTSTQHAARTTCVSDGEGGAIEGALEGSATTLGDGERSTIGRPRTGEFDGAR